MKQLLSYLDSIYPLSVGLRERIEKTLMYRQINKKNFLLKAGHVCQSICFIKTGLLRCFYLKDEQEVNSWFMKEGDVIISVESFFNQTPSYEFIQAIEDTETLCINYNQLEQLYRDYPDFNYIARVLLQKYYTLSEQRLYSLRMQRSHERYSYLLEHFPELVKRVPSKHLASYLGMTEVTLSKVRSGKY